METAEFKDILFDLINESNELSIINIAWNEDDNLFVVLYCYSFEIGWPASVLAQDQWHQHRRRIAFPFSGCLYTPGRLLHA